MKAENDMIRKQAMRLGPKNIPLPQIPAKIGGLRNSNSSSSSQEGSFDDGLSKLTCFLIFNIFFLFILIWKFVDYQKKMLQLAIQTIPLVRP